MRILDNYINKSIIKIFVMTILVFTFLYILVDATSDLDEFIDRKVPFDVLIQYYLTLTPIVVVQIAPIACLIAVLLTFSSLNNNNEIIVMRSSGLNFWQITKPALLFGLLVSVGVLFVNERYVPHAEEVTRQIRNENMILEVDRLRKKRENIRNLTFYGLKNRLYFVDTFNPHESEIEGVTIIGHDNESNIIEKIVALRGDWTGIAWKFYQMQVTSYDDGNINKPVKVRVYKEKLMDIKETPEDFMRQRINVSAMNIRQLYDYIQRFSGSGAKKALDSLRVDMHQKAAYPFGNFVIVLMGLPFALMVKSRKGQTFATLGIAITIAFIYYVANAVALAFGKGGLLPPILSAWSAPLLFTGIALIIIDQHFS